MKMDKNKSLLQEVNKRNEKKIILQEINRIREMMGISLLVESNVTPLVKKGLQFLGVSDNFIDNVIGKTADDATEALNKAIADELTSLGVKNIDELMTAAAERAGKLSADDVTAEMFIAFAKENPAVQSVIKKFVTDSAREFALNSMAKAGVDEIIGTGTIDMVDDAMIAFQKNMGDPATEQAAKELSEFLKATQNGLRAKGIPAEKINEIGEIIKTLDELTETSKSFNTKITSQVDEIPLRPLSFDDVADDLSQESIGGMDRSIDDILGTSSDNIIDELSDETTQLLSKNIRKQIDELINAKKLELPANVTPEKLADAIATKLKEGTKTIDELLGNEQLFNDLDDIAKVDKLKQVAAECSKLYPKTLRQKFLEKFNNFIYKMGDDGVRRLNKKAAINLYLYGLIPFGLYELVDLINEYTKGGQDPIDALKDFAVDTAFWPIGFLVDMDKDYLATEKSFIEWVTDNKILPQGSKIDVTNKKDKIYIDDEGNFYLKGVSGIPPNQKSTWMAYLYDSDAGVFVRNKSKDASADKGTSNNQTPTPPAYDNTDAGFKKWAADKGYTNPSFSGLWYTDNGTDKQAKYQDGTFK